jgi:hypothetical protein
MWRWSRRCARWRRSLRLGRRSTNRLPPAAVHWTALEPALLEALRHVVAHGGRSDLLLRAVRWQPAFGSRANDAHRAAGHGRPAHSAPSVLRRRPERDRGTRAVLSARRWPVFESLLLHLEAHDNEWDWVQLSGFVERGLYLSLSGYHPRMSGYSVMTTCTVEAIKRRCAGAPSRCH